MTEGSQSILLASPLAALLGLSLAMMVAVTYQAGRLDGWRGYGRLGRSAAGLATGLMAVLALALARSAFGPAILQGLPFWNGGLPGQTYAQWWDAAFIVAPALLPVMALLRRDALAGGVAAGMLGLGAPLLLGWPGLVASAGSLLAAFGIPRLPRRWPVFAGEARFALIGYAPGVLLLPVLPWAPAFGIVATTVALAALGPAFLAMTRLVGPPVPPVAAGADDGRAELMAAPLVSRTIADLPEGVAVFDAADRLVACNATYRRLNPLLGERLAIGAAYADLVRASLLRQPPQGAGAGDPEALIAAELARHAALPWRAEIPAADGGVLLVVETRTSEGGTLRLMSDISAAKGRERRLVELAGRNDVLATAVAAVSSGVVICDATQPGLPVTFANAAFTRITGYAAAEIMGRSCRILQGRDTDPETLDRIRRALALQRAVTVTLRNYRKDGRTFWNELAISPIAGEDGRVVQYVGIMNDVTQRMRAEESLREAKSQAELASRAKSEFLANVSHELRTPLNAIIGFSDVLRMQLFGPLGGDRYLGYANDILESGKLLLSLINDILDLSKIEAGKMNLNPEPVAVGEVFQSAMTLMRERARDAGVSLEATIAPDLPPLFADPRAMKQIVTNLVSNAVKFTPKDGSVELVARRLDEARAEIVVRDTGIGIARADIAEVLKPFVQVDGAHQRRHSGTGLGLPLVKALTMLSGGAFSLESELGVGTTVTLHLPLDSKPPARTAA